MNPDGKKLLKIRYRSDGTWEHVYDDGSVDQEFFQMNGQDLADLYKREREEKLKQYAILEEMKDMLVEEAMQYSDYRESKSVINHIMRK